MKKILACAICLFSLVAANSASAATGYKSGPITLGDGSAGTTNPPMTVQLSSNVLLDYDVTASSGLYYAVSSYHNKGTRTYASTSNDAKIFYTDSTAATAFTVPTSSASSAPGGKWLDL